MKKKLLTILLTIFVLCAGVFTLSACGGVKFKVNFIVDGEVYSTINTNGEEIIKIPDNPTKEGYTFDGWFWDKDVWEKPFTANSLLDAPLSSDMSVYAKFSLIHNCDFKEKVASDIYKATGATCENKATYYFSCSCGEKGTETFESGVAQGHSFTNYISDNNATCEADGTKTAKCENCEETDTITDVGSKLGHSFTNYISDNNATCEVDGTKTAVCNRNGCNKTDTITDVNSKLGHSFTNYISDNNATYDADGTKTAKCENCIATDTITDVGSKLQSGFAFNSNYQVNGRNVFTKVASETESVYFPDVITLVGNASYKVYRDINCDYELKAKEFTLVNIGENKCYILATVNGEDIFYHVTIYLRTKFTVDFITNNNTTIESQVIEEDSLAQKPNDLVKAGYTFNGYDFDFNTPITKNETVTALWTANDNTPYTVEYYLENLENEEYALTKTENLTGVTDTTAYAEIKTFEHFTAEKQTVSGNINGNGTTVLKVYYQRNEYTVSNANKSLGSITGAGKYKYGKQITLQSSPILAYNVNWYSGEELLSDSLCYTVTIDKNITAKFALKPEMANFNFTSTATTCVISGVKNKTITEIVVPNYVTSIKSGAFSGCSKLQSITIPFVGAKAGVTSSDTYQYPFGYIFGTSSYTGSTATTQHYYGSSTSSTTSATYYIPTSLKEVTVTGGNILSYAFENCDNLTSVVIGDSVKSIGGRAFYNCDSLTSVVIGDSVTSIGEYAFSGCGKLVEVINKSDLDIQKNSYGLNALIVHKGESKIVNANDYLFITVDGTNYLVNYIGNDTELKLPQNFNGQDYVIKNYAFSGCDSLTSVEIPNSVTSIGDHAFASCHSLTSVVIGDSVTSIGDFAFSDCDSLTSVEIPNSVTSIGSFAFYYCSSLTSVNYTGTIDEWVQIEFSTSSNPLCFAKKLYINGELVTEANLTTATKISDYSFEGCTSLTSVTMPNSVTSIGSSAFSGCTSLTSIEIPNSVTSIGSSAFYGCSKLESITLPFVGAELNGTSNTHFGYIFGAYLPTSLKTVIITGGSSIGEDAFRNCRSLTSIEIPNSVTSIGSYAFYGCHSLTSVVIGDSVTSIGSYAFSGCNSLTSIEMPNSVTSIGSYAFEGCTSLTSVEIPDSVTSIGNGSFYDCDSLTSITLPFVGASLNGTSNMHFGYIFGAYTYSSNSNYVPTSLKEVIITGGSSIGYYAFSGCNSLTSIEIPNSVTSIGDYAFSGCTSLTSVYYNGTIDEWVQLKFNNYYSNPLYYAKNLYINNQLVTEANIITPTKINAYAFFNCTSLTSIVIGDGVTSIGDYAFYGCHSLTSVVIGDSVTSIGDYAFSGCNSLTSIEIPNSVTSIGNGAFSGCTSLTSVEIPDSVTSIGNGAFYDCDSLTSITLPFVGASLNGTSNMHFGYIFGASSYSYNDDYVPTSLKEVIITGGSSIGSYAFFNCTSLTSIVIGDGVTSIGDSAFYYCNSLTSVVIGDSVTSIGNGAFSGCNSLTSIEIPNSVTSIGDYAFSGCNSLTSIEIPNSVTSIGDYAFYNCYSLTIYCEATSKPSGWDGDWNYSSCPVVWNRNNNDVATDGYIYTVIDGIRYSLKDGVATVVEQPRNITSANIPSTVTYKGITYNVTSIGYYAFEDCDSLTSVVIGDGVTSIGSSAFYYCNSLTSVVIGDSVTSIGSSAFYGCTSLTSVEIPDSVTSIGSSAFYGCYKLVEVINKSSHITITKSTSNGYLGYYALAIYNSDSGITESQLNIDNGYIIYTEGNEKVLVGYNGTETKLVLPTYITKINAYAFYYCDSLTSIVIPDSVTSIGDNAFYSCNSLTSVYYNGTIDEWVQIEFNNYSNPLCYAKNLYINNELVTEANITTATKINAYAFFGCASLTSIVIGDSVTSIGGRAFYNCNSLTSIEIPNSVTSIGGRAFYNCNSLTSVVVPNSVTSIGDYAFAYCDNLTSATIGTGVTSIGSYAFYNCSKLTSLIFRDTSTWYRTTSNTDWNNKTNGTSTSVTSSSSNATYFKSTYYNYYWYKL